MIRITRRFLDTGKDLKACHGIHASLCRSGSLFKPQTCLKGKKEKTESTLHFFF